MPCCYRRTGKLVTAALASTYEARNFDERHDLARILATPCKPRPNTTPHNPFAETRTTAEEPYFDAIVYDYDAINNKLSWKNQKYEYPAGVQFTLPMVSMAIVTAAGVPVPGVGLQIDPDVGDETDAMFNQIHQQLLSEPRSGPMGFFAGCDVDFNQRCDAADQQLMQQALGTCEGTIGFLRLADVDSDGCITQFDTDAWTKSFDQLQDIPCDADGDRDVDSQDLQMIRSANGQMAAPGDRRDGNADGAINVADARFCSLRCTRPGCAQ